MKALRIIALIALTPCCAPAAGQSDELRTDTFGYDRVSRVQVLNADIFTIEVTGVGGSDLEAQVIAPADSRLGIEHRRSGETVMIRAYQRTKRPGWLAGVGGPYRLVLSVPEECELDIKTTTGSVSVTGVAGAKRLETDTGTIAVRESDGDAVATTKTGSQSFSTVLGNVALRATTGSISLTDVEGTMDVQTDTGRIEGIDLRLTDHSTFMADTGSITLKLAQTLDDFSFQLRSDTGKIVVGDSETRGRLVIGRGPIRLRVETDTGGVRISGR